MNRTGAIEPATAMMNVGVMVAVGITYYDLGLRRSAAAIGALWGVLLYKNAIYLSGEVGRRPLHHQQKIFIYLISSFFDIILIFIGYP